ncbi:unnamed protein product [Adineta ricciae]|uniref:Uncharacterized protein n=1 Tax=Adineta ricciae TaxID=249248 RepID=A0A815TJ20_ADIRI|nr:unnamed protein product [Adineta ricciae]
MTNMNEAYSPISDDDELFDIMSSSMNYDINDEEMKQFFESNPSILSFNDVEETLKSTTECDFLKYHSDAISSILQTPDYLSVEHIKEQFGNMLQQKVYQIINTMQTETIQIFAALLHQLETLDLEIKLWNHYIQLGTADVEQHASNSITLWPADIKTMILAARSSSAAFNDPNALVINDDDYFKFVQCRLQHLYEKQDNIKQELMAQKCSFPGFTTAMEHILKAFVEENTAYLRLKYDYQNKFIDFDYHDQLFDYKFKQQNPNVLQIELSNSVFAKKYQYEMVKQEFLWIQKQINNNKLLTELNNIQLSLASTFQSLADINLRQTLIDRHREVIQKYQQDMTTIIYDTMEAKLNELHNIFEGATATMWLIQQSFPMHLRMNQTMIDLIEHHLPILTQKAKYIYEYKNALEALYNAKPSYVPSSFGVNRNQSIVSTMVQLYDRPRVIDNVKRFDSQESFRCQIHQVLQEWNRLQKQKKEYQLQRQNTAKKSIGFWGGTNHEYEEFDRIMEEDLENQLKELECQEEEQMRKTEQILEKELAKTANNNQDIESLERYCMELLDEYDTKQRQENCAKVVAIEQGNISQSSNHITRYSNIYYFALHNCNSIDTKLSLPTTMHKTRSCTNENGGGNFDMEIVFDDDRTSSLHNTANNDGDHDDDIQIIEPSDSISTSNKTKSTSPIRNRRSSKTEQQTNPEDFRSVPSQTVTFAKTLDIASIIRINFNETPYYLSKKNPSFEQIIYHVLPRTTHVENFRSIAVLFFKSLALELVRSLWIVYRQSGLGELETALDTKGIDAKIWPKEILNLIQDYEPNIKNKDLNHICLAFVNECLQQMTTKDQEYQHELRIWTTSLTDYTSTLDQMIKKFVDDGLRGLRLEVSCHIAMTHCYYQDEILKQQFLVHNPTDEQIAMVNRLCKLNYKFETAKHEWNLLNEKILIHLIDRPFDGQAILQSTLINAMREPNLRLQLHMQYHNIYEHVKNNKLNVYMNKVKDEIPTQGNIFNEQMDKLWENNKSNSCDQRLSYILSNIIDRRLANITARVGCIYHYKRKLSTNNSRAATNMQSNELDATAATQFANGIRVFLVSTQFSMPSEFYSVHQPSGHWSIITDAESPISFQYQTKNSETTERRRYATAAAIFTCIAQYVQMFSRRIIAGSDRKNVSNRASKIERRITRFITNHT